MRPGATVALGAFAPGWRGNAANQRIVPTRPDRSPAPNGPGERASNWRMLSRFRSRSQVVKGGPIDGETLLIAWRELESYLPQPARIVHRGGELVVSDYGAWKEKVLAQRKTFVAPRPDAAAIFDFLERHWPYLVNAIESRIVPTTNNATEQVIRIFTQHCKIFCGFENIESARLYLGVFEKVYRFSPFSNDAQKRIRGQCPLELAGYEVQKRCPEPVEGLPMASSSAGWPSNGLPQLSRSLSKMCDGR